MLSTVATQLTLPSPEIPGQGFGPNHGPISTTSGGIDDLIARIDAERAAQKPSVPKKPTPKKPTAAQWRNLMRDIRAVRHDPEPMPMATVQDLAAFAYTVQKYPREAVIMVHASPRPMPYMPGPEEVIVDWSAAAYVPKFLGKGPNGTWRIDSRSKGQAPIRVRVPPHGDRRQARRAAVERAWKTARAVAEWRIYDLLDHAATRQKKDATIARRAESARTVPIR